ncbi:MAG: hypothetical protein ABI877_18350, partial [Gemmatimonadaceae bacterium]
LLEGAIDYAGLFPPAALGMEDAARNYLEYALGSDAWALGRFVVPMTRLDELHRVAVELAAADRVAWRLSVLAGASPAAEAVQLREFLARAGSAWSVEAIEAKAASAMDIEALSALVTDWRLYVEIPLGGEIEVAARRVNALGASVKIRTGGITAEAFPAASQLAHALLTCARIPVPFKATAGLHHPIRAEYPLTYALDSGSGTMFGYLNLLLAAVLARRQASEELVTQLLEERDPTAFALGDDVLRWRAEVFGMEEVRGTRTEFVHGFGSCSFREPLDEFTAPGVS